MPTINTFPIQTKRVADLDVMAGSDISGQDKTLVYDQSLGLWKSVTIAESAYYSGVVFNTPAQAALASLPVGAKYSTKGCLSIGDGGHGDFIVEAASGTPDGYSRVLLANGNHGVLQQPYNVKQFGLLGSPNDTIAFGRCLKNMTDIDLNGATVNILHSSDSQYTISNKTIRNATLNIVLPSASYARTFNSNGNVRFINCKVVYTVPLGGQAVFLRPWTGDVIQNCDIDGGVFNNAGALSHNFYAFQIPGTGVQNNVQLLDSAVRNCSFVHLKINSSTSTQIGWRVSNCEFSGIFTEGVGLNSPSGVVKDFQISNCKFLTHLGRGVGNYSLYVAVASAEGLSITDNWFEGECDQCIHIEEAVNGFTITGNRGSVDCKGGVIGVLENAVGGVLHFPERGVISGNNFKKAGIQKEANTYGIFLTDNGNPSSPAKNIVITNNVFDGFGRGYSLDAQAQDKSFVSANIAANCSVGFYLVRSFGFLEGNASINCDTGVVSSGRAKAVKHHTFENCNTLISGRITLNGATIHLGTYPTVAGGIAYANLFATSASQKHNVTYSIISIKDNSDISVSVKTGTFTFDGTTAGGSVLNTTEPGSIQSFYEYSSGFVRVGVFSSAAGQLDTTVQLDGFISNL